MNHALFRIQNRKLLKKLDSFPAFRDASNYAKETRISVATDVLIKVIFAENELQAEDLLSSPREAKIIGGDDD
ncbi:MAG TPA: hypothetical protein PLK99_00330 [Burkholderiales bacterium]|nr:hypothetical protein [Burkholderiales bacterium]